MTPFYRWEIQTINPVTGGWCFTDAHPRGVESTPSTASEFAWKVGVVHGRFAPDDQFRVVVWSGDEVAAVREFGAGTL